MCKFYLNILNKQTVFKSVVSTILIHKGICVIRVLKALGMEKFLAGLAVFMHDSSILSKIEYKKISPHSRPRQAQRERNRLCTDRFPIRILILP